MQKVKMQVSMVSSKEITPKDSTLSSWSYNQSMLLHNFLWIAFLKATFLWILLLLLLLLLYNFEMVKSNFHFHLIQHIWLWVALFVSKNKAQAHKMIICYDFRFPQGYPMKYLLNMWPHAYTQHTLPCLIFKLQS